MERLAQRPAAVGLACPLCGLQESLDELVLVVFEALPSGGDVAFAFGGERGGVQGPRAHGNLARSERFAGRASHGRYGS
jgi:hypothetical protein